MIEVRPFRAEKIDKPRNALALSTHKNASDWAGSRPLDIEVGCGVGWHPIQYAQRNAGRRLVAIEHTKTRFSRFERRLAHHPRIENLLAVHADAVAWVTHFVEPESVDRYFFLYPNPRPRPWHSMPFFGRLLSTLKPGGKLTLATNEQGYCQEARRYFTQAWGLRIDSDLRYCKLSMPAPEARTHFEKKYLARGETCYELVASKALPSRDESARGDSSCGE